MPVLVHSNELIVVMCVHVDDYIIATSDSATSWFDNFMLEFQNACKIKYLGQASHILQMSLDWHGPKLQISNNKYIKSLCEKYGISDTPVYHLPNCDRQPDEVVAEVHSPLTLPYRELLGALLWL